ncbi:MAG TPA: PTS sugar transporter subunit IIC [Neisseriales bacterium]|nr:PTS sugar transporter subunit IIC [Neisseriales bacterium]
MSFNPLLIAQQIYAELAPCGITAVATCMTRLRVTINDKRKFDLAKLKAITGVLGVVDTPDQIQIIIGPGKVNQVYEQFMLLFNAEVTTSTSIAAGSQKSATSSKDIKEQLKQKNATPFKLFLKKLANIFIPMIPAFIGCGLILGIVNILAKTLTPEMLGGVAFDQSTIGIILKLLGGGITFGLALFAGLNASKEFGGTPILGGVLAAVLTMPDLAKLTIFGEHAVPGRGGIIAVLFVCIFAAWLEKRLRKIIPVSLDLFVTPTLVLLIAGFLAIFILQPIGGIISDAITNGSKLAVDHGGPVVGFILSAAFLPLVMTGLHQGLTPIHAELIKTTGSTVLLPILAMAGAGQVGAALAVWMKTKNEKLKHIIKSGIVVGFLGVGEPLIYGVTLPLFRPFIAACIGGGLGGAFVATFKLGATGLGISGLPLTLLIHNGMLMYLAAILIAYVGGFIATWLIGFDDSVFE